MRNAIHQHLQNNQYYIKFALYTSTQLHYSTLEHFKMVAISTFLTIITATLATKAIAAPSDLDARQLQHQIFSIDIDDDCNHVGSKPPINPAGGAIFVEQNNTCFPQVQPYNVLFIFSSSPENAAGLTCGCKFYTSLSLKRL